MRISKFFLLSFFFLLLFIFLLTSYIKISTSGIIGELPKDGKIAPNLRISSKSNQTGIYFGDLHVHTTFSQDAFMFSLPMLQGEGAHPPRHGGRVGQGDVPKGLGTVVCLHEGQGAQSCGWLDGA